MAEFPGTTKKDKTMSKRKKDDAIRETEEYKQQMLIGQKVLNDYPITLKKLSK